MELILVILISIPLSVITNSTFLTGIINTPPGMTYLGVTHYYQDYFAYMSQVMQGVNGLWLTQDLYTTEKTVAVPAYWMNILLGHISRITNIPPILLFNGSACVLVFLMLICSYLFYKRVFQRSRPALIAFLFFVFSTSVLNRLPPTAPYPYWPFELWSTPHLMFNRLITLPHHSIQTLLFMAILTLLFNEKQRLRPLLRNGFLLFCTALLTFLQPIMVGMLTGAYVVTMVLFEKRKPWNAIVAISIGFLVPFIVMVLAFQGEPHIQLRLWEKATQTLTTTPFLLLSIGPIVPFAAIGMWNAVKKRTPLGITGFLLVIGGYFLFRFPGIDQAIGITNVRVVFPGTILFLAWFGTVGVDVVSTWISKRLNAKKSLVEALCVALFLLAVAPTIVWEIQQKINPRAPITPVNYIPTTTMAAYTFLKNQSPYTTVALGNPETLTNYLIPALSGHVSVSGHPLLTIHSEEKISNSLALFALSMDEAAAKEWLTRERVTYVVFTDMDGSKEAFEQAYPFLTPVFSTPTATVYQRNL